MFAAFNLNEIHYIYYWIMLKYFLVFRWTIEYTSQPFLHYSFWFNNILCLNLQDFFLNVKT